MSVEDVARFVTEAGFESYAEAFIENKVTGEQLEDFGKVDLLEIGIAKLDRVRFLVKIREKKQLSFGGKHLLIYPILLF